MIGLPCFERNITICYAVSIQYRNATDNGQISYINIVRQHTDARYKYSGTTGPGTEVVL